MIGGLHEIFSEMHADRNHDSSILCRASVPCLVASLWSMRVARQSSSCLGGKLQRCGCAFMSAALGNPATRRDSAGRELPLRLKRYQNEP